MNNTTWYVILNGRTEPPLLDCPSLEVALAYLSHYKTEEWVESILVRSVTTTREKVQYWRRNE